jgi:programmed cell death 6-interacting protein
MRDKTVAAAKQIATYHDSLLTLESRVSMTENDARIDWKWTDFNGRHKKICSSAFERANLIFCYAAVLSQVAESCNPKDEASLKQAVTSLKTAGSAFDYLANNGSMLGSTAGDISSDVLSAYSLVMYAQAQECVLLKAEQGSIPAHLLAKLASKTRECYEESLKKCNVSSYRHAIPKDWCSTLQMKLSLHSALAQYYQAEACADAKQYGEQVARLQLAYDQIKNASRSGSSFTRQPLVEKIKHDRDVAIKDNDFIYHETIPAAKDLSPVPTQGTIGRTQLPIPLLGSEVKDIFASLVPMAVVEAKTKAMEEMRRLIAVETQRLTVATDALNAVMISLNLPAAIQGSSSGKIPDELLQKAAKIRQLGGAEQLREAVYSLPDSAERNREILKQQQSTLDDEENTDVNLRKQFGDRWTRQPSRKLNEQWRNDIAKMLNFLVETEKTDKSLASRFEEQSDLFELISKSDEEITAAVQSHCEADLSSPTGNENQRQELAAVCSQIETLKTDRGSLSDQLGNFQLSDDVQARFLELYREHNEVPAQSIHDAADERLQGLRECIRASETKQTELLADLQRKYEKYFGRASSGGQGGFVTRLNAAADGFIALDRDVKEGMKFYAELTDRCLKVQEKIDDFCLARTTEKTEHMADITTNLSRVTVSDTPSAPPTVNSAPSRPPPTYQDAAQAPSNPTPTPQAPSSVTAPSTQGMPVPPYNQPGSAWGAPVYNYGSPTVPYPTVGMPAYPQAGGMPMYSYYAYAPMPTAQMPMPPYQMMPGQPGAYTPGQPNPANRPHNS